MPELRKDPVIGRWIIISTERQKRPHDFSINHNNIPVNDFRSDCPFCPGNEKMTPPEVLAYRDDGEKDGRGWRIRIVSNKYPALDTDGELKKRGMGIYDIINGVGAHDVVIETPVHNATFGVLDREQIESYLWALRERMVALMNDSRLQYIIVFKNHGSVAGATLEHPHSQIIALPIVPKRVQEEIAGCRTYYEMKERCIFCDIMNQEEFDNRRIVLDTERFMVITPFASRLPYELWIIPKRHIASFPDTDLDEIKELSSIFKETFGRLEAVLQNPPYNMMLHTAPCQTKKLPYYHWHIELIPKLGNVAGFEWGTGFYINPVSPEDAAEHLRSATIKVRCI
ncbi:MAG: galactose-1-phosphate uridylyltransferase [Candidatus Coatesbacteria bacterium]|nr:MAG: galactose-1-phosphate uridylyltransferase [Candidatus Coatesbacteria bacterium]RLC43419.1 MAG: galactose-1-phosphate uridylyltransferase [Candidatus Coatesbacteria bacterium]RLC43896.1 MAG: galactose-1-phosphate uridylyltransferase [Candidatus Coatesbacteria bacterium]HEC80032.1 galactose-1-phosphate uridylyltransferase [Bacillota bacterium]